MAYLTPTQLLQFYSSMQSLPEYCSLMRYLVSTKPADPSTNITITTLYRDIRRVLCIDALDTKAIDELLYDLFWGVPNHMLDPAIYSSLIQPTNYHEVKPALDWIENIYRHPDAYPIPQTLYAELTSYRTNRIRLADTYNLIEQYNRLKEVTKVKYGFQNNDGSSLIETVEGEEGWRIRINEDVTLKSGESRYVSTGLKMTTDGKFGGTLFAYQRDIQEGAPFVHTFSFKLDGTELKPLITNPTDKEIHLKKGDFFARFKLVTIEYMDNFKVNGQSPAPLK